MPYDYERDVGPNLPDWLKEFAIKELKNGNLKEGKESVEARVKELQERVGLNIVLEGNENAETKTASDQLIGGLGDGTKNEDFDKKQMEMGRKVEMEHTTKPEIADEISRDHLAEYDEYYDYLEEAEKKMEKDKKKAEKITSLVILANSLEESGDIEGAKIIDAQIEILAKKLDEKLPKVLKKHPKIKETVENICKSRGGHIDYPAILKLLKDEFPEEIDVQDGNLRKYIKRFLKKEKKEIDEPASGTAKMIFVVTENEIDDNNKVFYTPSARK